MATVRVSHLILEEAAVLRSIRWRIRTKVRTGRAYHARIMKLSDAIIICQS
jgi:hypothetical protein